MKLLLAVLLLCVGAHAQAVGGKTGLGGKAGLGGGPTPAVGTITFTHAQTTCYGEASVAAQTSVTATCGSVPDTTKAHVLIVGVSAFLSSGVNTVQDENGNVYSPNPQGCASLNDGGGQGTECLYFLLMPVSGNAGKAITVTLIDNGFTGAPFFPVYVDDFTSSGRTPVFNIDAVAIVTGASAGNTSLPSITPSASGELLYAGGNSSDGFTGVGGSWTENDHGAGQGGVDTEYIMSSSSGATAVSFSDPNPFSYMTVALAFK